MKFWKPYFVICKTFLLLAAALVCASAGWAQKSAETISTVVIDSAPKKLYSELYFDENSNPFKNQYSWAEDTSDDDYKAEAGRRRGKGGRGDRRRGGGGLR